MTLIDEFGSIMAKGRLIALFQPIVSLLKRDIIGYEALIRGPSDSPLHAPLNLFDAASRCDRLLDLELLCLEISIERFQGLALPGKLFLNVSPASVLQPDFIADKAGALLGPIKQPVEQLVIELTEQYPTENYDIMRMAMDYYRSKGFQIAIDDLGAGYGGLRLWSELRPEYVKIDRHFISGIEKDPVKQEFVRNIYALAQSIGCQAIAEGIETAAEYHFIQKLGISIGQGYWFGRPEAIPEPSIPSTRFDSGSFPTRPIGLSETVVGLVKPITCVAPNVSVNEVSKLFRSNPTLTTLPVVMNGTPLGVVRRSQIMKLLLTPSGPDLHGRKPIGLFVDNQALQVDKEIPVEQVSKLITTSSESAEEQDFIITEQGRYLGIGKLLDLLRKITDLQIRHARYANPLTFLPGSVPISEHVENLLREAKEFTVCYCDLDNFKPFNDHYGYRKGDQVIRKIAKLLIKAADPDLDFAGHIGGDDFFIAFRSPDWQARCQQILNDFEKAAPGFYSKKDRAQGGIQVKNRSGQDRFFAFLTLSIGCAQPDPRHCRSHHDVAALASLAKIEAQKIPGNSLFLDRRRKPSQTS